MAAQDELVLLERVFLRIGSADTDDQLEKVLCKFLPPVLLKLSSQQEGVRKKVMELLVHVNKRLRSRPQVQLPVESLLLQYQDPAASSFLINFTIIYLKLGFPRLPVEKKLEMLPGLLASISGKPQKHQDSLLLLALEVLPSVKIPSDPAKRSSLLGLADRADVATILRDCILDFLLLPYSPVRPTDEGVTPPPPGLSEYSHKRLQKEEGEQALSSEQIEKLKLGLVRFIACGVFPDLLVVPHLVIAASDTRHSVASSADLELRKVTGVINWDDAALNTVLFSLYLGTTVSKDQTIRPELRRAPANTRIRLKIFPYLLKSTTAVQQFPAAIQIIFETLYGANTNSKLKSMALKFVHSMVTNCPEAKLKPIQTVLLSGMLKLINSSEDLELKNLAYVAVGKLGIKFPSLVTSDLMLLTSLFSDLNNQSAETRAAVQEALSILVSTFKANLKEDLYPLLEALLHEKITNRWSQVRQVAVHYTASIFHPQHVQSRYLLLLAAGDEVDDIRAEALKALRKCSPKDEITDENEPAVLPDFSDFIRYIVDQATIRLKSSQGFTVAGVTLPFNPKTFLAILQLARRSLAAGAGVPGHMIRTDQWQEEYPVVAEYLRLLLTSRQDSVMAYLHLCIDLLRAVKDSSVVQNILELVAMVPDVTTSSVTAHMGLFKKLLIYPKDEVREPSANLAAIVAAYSLETDEQFIEFLSEIQHGVKDKLLESKHGNLLCLGHAIGWRLQRIKNLTGDISSELQVAVDQALKTFVEHLSSEEGSGILTGACCQSLSEVGRTVPLRLLLPSTGISLEDLVEKLTHLVCISKTNVKVCQKAAIACGSLTLGDSEFPLRRQLLEKLLKAAFSDLDVDTLFTIGESFGAVLLGSNSPAARNIWVEKEKTPSPENGHQVELEWLLHELLNTYILHSKPSVRLAGCVWCFSIIQSCGHMQPIKMQLRSIQESLMNMLADPNDLVQDVTSKALSLLYDLGSEEDRKELVALLIETLTSGRKSKVNISSDTQVFSEGILGKSPTGGNLTTYKELCSLATDLNQPDLMYKFMHLASHNALWNSRKGAAFGFGSIAKQAEAQLSTHLPTAVPKLYRYQFDPNTGIRQSFSFIWQAVVPEPQKSIDKYIKEILQDLLNNLTNNQWRVREASCLAVSDVLRGRDLSSVLHFLPELWETCFRVRDDIKESVRNAAESALKTLSKVSVKLCEVNNPLSEKTLELVLPSVVKVGLGSSVSEVRAISLSTVSKLSRSAGQRLGPHLPLLVPVLLESLSEVEPQAFNYLSVRLEAGSQEILDSARIAATRSSPLTDTLNYCVQFMDESVLEELSPKLNDILRHTVGLATKAGCANLIISLTHQKSSALQPHAGKLLASCMHGLNDRNSAVRKTFANTIGHLVKVSKESSVEKLVGKIQTWYLEKPDSSVQASCATTIKAMAQHSPDVVRNHAAQILPMAFLGMHTKANLNSSDDLDLNVIAAQWDEVWVEFTGGPEAGTRLYLNEICALICQALSSTSWPIKAKAASALKTVAERVKDDLPTSLANQFLQELMVGLKGRTWDGKEHLVQALAAVSVNCCIHLKENNSTEDAVLNEVMETFLREMKKENVQYKLVALKAGGLVTEKLHIDCFVEISNVVKQILLNPVEENENKDSDTIKKTTESLEEVSLDTLAQAWPQNTNTQDAYFLQILDMMVVVFKKSVWKVQVAILRNTKTIFQKTDVVQLSCKEEDLHSYLEKILTVSLEALGSSKYATLRLEAISVIITVIEKLKGSGKESILPKSILKEIQRHLEVPDSNFQVQERGKNVLHLLYTVL